MTVKILIKLLIFSIVDRTDKVGWTNIERVDDNIRWCSISLQ